MLNSRMLSNIYSINVKTRFANCIPLCGTSKAGINHDRAKRLPNLVENHLLFTINYKLFEKMAFQNSKKKNTAN
jgi:hypothetical protein